MESQQTAEIAISQVLKDYYFKGIYEGDTSLLNEVYHPGTLLFGDVKGEPYAKTLAAYLAGVAQRQSPRDSGKPFQGDILAIKVVQSIALAEVKVKMYEFNYHEFLSFHKIEGRWMIVNKMIADVKP